LFERFFGGVFLKKGNKKRVSYSHRTATTACPCSVPSLGDSAGAGRERLTRGKSMYFFAISTVLKKIFP